MLQIIKKLLDILLLFLLFISFCFAETKKILNWKDCVEISMKNNPDLIIAQKKLESAIYTYNLAWNSYYPSADLRYGYSNTNLSTSSSRDWDFGVSASQTLFDKQKISDIKIKKFSLEQSEAEFKQTAALIRYNLKQAFLRIQYIQENIKLLKSIYDIRVQTADIVRLQYDGGKESKGNMLRANAQKNSAYIDITNAEKDLVVAKNFLLECLGLDKHADFSINGTLTKVKPVKIHNLEEVMKTIPKILIAQSSLKIAQNQLLYAKSSLFPTLKMNGSWNLADKDAGLYSSANEESWNFGITATYSVFGGGLTSTKNNIAIAKSTLEQSEENLKKVQLNVKSELQNLQTELEKNYNNVETIKLFLEAAIQRQKEANIKYMAGRLDFQFWQDIEQELVNYELNNLSALYKLNLSLVEKENLLGIIFEEINK
ncbi:MAG: TolC family protein [Elusimicrobiota bacterium]|jgi:outer membrane protein TolC|nr:TolC family protein [Elusimicrobiota bacterium]